MHYRRWISRARNIWRTVNVWSHPLKRGLGPAPTTATGQAKVDAYFYIGRPGFSGGSCNGGPLPVGSWFEERALMFGRYATEWIRPPKGTRNGLPGRPSARSLAGDQYGLCPAPRRTRIPVTAGRPIKVRQVKARPMLTPSVANTPKRDQTECRSTLAGGAGHPGAVKWAAVLL